MIIIVWVDDLIIAASDVSVLNNIKSSLSNKFKMKDLKELKWFLGIEFEVENGCITMNQSNYVINEDSKEIADAKLYREIVGSLIYLMTGTKPDLFYIVSKLSQSLSNPSKSQLDLANVAGLTAIRRYIYIYILSISCSELYSHTALYIY